MFGIDIYGRGKASEFIRPIFRFIDKWDRRLIWGFKYRFIRKHQYNLIDTKLEPGYYDIDTLMLHGNMALLVRYVDKEHGGVEDLQKHVDYLNSAEFEASPKPDGDHAWDKVDTIALELYHWWTVDRPADHKLLEDMQISVYRSKKSVFDPIDVHGNPVSKDEAELFQMRTENTNTPSPFTSENVWALEARLLEEDTENLIKLIKIRGGLWT